VGAHAAIGELAYHRLVQQRTLDLHAEDVRRQLERAGLLSLRV
jgi:hypothetical protein